MVVTTYPLRQKMSVEQFLALPEGPPDYEFEQGEAILVVRPDAKHQKEGGTFRPGLIPE